MNRIEFLSIVKQAQTTDDYLRIVRKHLIHGIPFVLHGNENLYYDFREKIAKRWNVGFNEVLILGSGKLGFSYHKDSVFSQESDIDVAIVNAELFESFYLRIRNFQYDRERGIEVLTAEEEKAYNRFLEYMIKGWMRPDLLPMKITGRLSKQEWFDFFKSISYRNNSLGNYKVAAGLFKNFNYMEWYYVNSLMTVKV